MNIHTALESGLHVRPERYPGEYFDIDRTLCGMRTRSGQLFKVGRLLASGLTCRAVARQTGWAVNTVAKLRRIMVRADRLGPVSKDLRVYYGSDYYSRISPRFNRWKGEK